MLKASCRSGSRQRQQAAAYRQQEGGLAVSPSLHATSIHAHSCLQALDYGVREGNILGIKHGFKGFLAKPHRPVVLTRQAR